MKKIFLLIAAPFVLFTALSAQVTQEEADGIVLERLSQRLSDYYTLYAKENVQTEMTVITATREELELDYPCWVYYASHFYRTNLNCYLIVNESNGNLLEVKAQQDTGPNDLTAWREVELGIDLLELGMYVEVFGAPYYSTEIIFLDRENLVMRGKLWSGEDQYYKYEVSDNSNRIKLTLKGSTNSGELYFRVINSRKFAITYLYPHTHVGPPPPPLIFEKKVTTPILIGKGELHGNGSEGITKQNLVITNKKAWDNLVDAMNSVNNVSNSFTETDIDFSKYQVIAIFDQLRSSSGYDISITNITEYADSIVVDVNHVIPNGSVLTVMTQPFHIVKIPVSDKSIIFNDLTYGCEQYVENELLIWLAQGVDATEFAASYPGITPKSLVSGRLNIWLFETDGTEDLKVIIGNLSQNPNVLAVQLNHTGIKLRSGIKG